MAELYQINAQEGNKGEQWNNYVMQLSLTGKKLAEKLKHLLSKHINTVVLQRL